MRYPAREPVTGIYRSAFQSSSTSLRKKGERKQSGSAGGSLCIGEKARAKESRAPVPAWDESDGAKDPEPFRSLQFKHPYRTY